jgi:hypothetical protein
MTQVESRVQTITVIGVGMSISLSAVRLGAVGRWFSSVRTEASSGVRSAFAIVLPHVGNCA